MSQQQQQAPGTAAERGGQPTCSHDWKLHSVSVGEEKDKRLGTRITTQWRCACGRTRAVSTFSREPIAR